jgi:hypothetical protein
MKKRVLLTGTILLAGLSTQAQTWDSTNEPAVGNSTTMYVVDSLAPNYANLVGSGQTWDYSTLSGYSGNNRAVTCTDPATSLYSSDFPNSDFMLAIEGFSNNFYTVSSDEKNTQGFVLLIDGVGEAIINFSATNMLSLEYPMTYDSQFNSSFAGTADILGSTSPAEGDIYVHADATGTLLLANDVSHSDVLRIRTVDTTYTEVDPFGFGPIPVTIIRSQFDYFKASESAFPLFSHISVNVVNGFAPVSFNVVLSSENPTTFVGTAELEKQTSFNVYPNPSNGEVFITVPSVDESTVISVFDAVGKEIRSVKVNSTTTTVSLQNEPKGLYFVRMTSKGEQKTVKLVLK